MNTILSKSFLFIATSLLMYSCTNEQNSVNSKTNVAVSLDSLESMWDKAWNTKDTAAIINMLDDNATLISEGSAVGKDAFIKKFVKLHIGTFGNMKTVKISDESTADMAFLSGSYTANTMKRDSITGNENGLFTIIWRKQPDKSWKMRMIQL